MDQSHPDPRAVLAEARAEIVDDLRALIEGACVRDRETMDLRRDTLDPEVAPEVERIESLLARIDAALAGMGWQPIATVSHENDGYLLRARYPGMTNMTDPYFGWWMENEKRWARWPHRFPPTHFMVVPPLPEPPGESVDFPDWNDRFIGTCDSGNRHTCKTPRNSASGGEARSSFGRSI